MAIVIGTAMSRWFSSTASKVPARSQASRVAVREQRALQQVLGPLDGFRQSKTMFAAMSLGIFDTLQQKKTATAAT
jgi:hypothetical protein